MPDEIKQTNNDVIITQKRETVELLDSAGNTANRDTPLAAIFEKMERGATVQEAVDSTKPKEEKKEVQQTIQETTKQPEKTELEKRLEDTQDKKDVVKEEVKQPEIKNGDEVPEEELQVLQTDKPKTAKRIQALLSRVNAIKESEANTKKELEARDAKLKELDAQLVEAKKVTVDPATEAAIKQQQDELAMFRRRYELDKDPEVKSKFDDRISSSEKPIAEVLTRNGAAESLLKIVEQEGGWLNFSRSGRLVSLADGQKPAAEVAELIMQAIPFADRQTIQSVTMDQISTKRDRERFFQEEQKKATDYFKRKEDEAGKATVEYQKQVEEAKKTIETWQKKVTTENEWLKEKEIPATASAEQKTALEEDNKYTKQLHQLLTKAINTKDIPGMLEVVKESVQYHQERRLHAKTQATAEALRQENLKLKDELTRFKNASRTTSKAGSLLAEGNTPPQKKQPPQTIEEAFDMIAAGKSPFDESE